MKTNQMYVCREQRLILDKSQWQEFFKKFIDDYENDFDAWWQDMERYDLIQPITQKGIQELLKDDGNEFFPYSFDFQGW